MARKTSFELWPFTQNQADPSPGNQSSGRNAALKHIAMSLFSCLVEYPSMMHCIHDTVDGPAKSPWNGKWAQSKIWDVKTTGSVRRRTNRPVGSTAESALTSWVRLRGFLGNGFRRTNCWSNHPAEMGISPKIPQGTYGCWQDWTQGFGHTAY